MSAHIEGMRDKGKRRQCQCMSARRTSSAPHLTKRMARRRFTRLTNALSRKFGNHVHMVAIYTVWYNFVKCEAGNGGPYKSEWSTNADAGS